MSRSPSLFLKNAAAFLCKIHKSRTRKEIGQKKNYTTHLLTAEHFARSTYPAMTEYLNVVTGRKIDTYPFSTAEPFREDRRIQSGVQGLCLNCTK